MTVETRLLDREPIPGLARLMEAGFLTDYGRWMVRRKGAEFAYPDGMTERSWERVTQRIFRRHRPLPLLLAGDLVAAYALLKAVRP